MENSVLQVQPGIDLKKKKKNGIYGNNFIIYWELNDKP